MSYNFHEALFNAMPLKRKRADAVDGITQSTQVERKTAMAGCAEITTRDISVKSVPNFRDFVNHQEPDYRISIPSHDRSERLCTCTLALLRRHGIDMKRVYVFIDPEATAGDGTPQWFLYLEAFRRHDFLNVNLHPGKKGLAAQLRRIFEWAKRGYLLVLTDDILDVRERRVLIHTSSARLEPLAAGMLKPLFAHSYSLLRAGDYTAWSLNASTNLEHMSDSGISVKLGLLEGNMSGYLLADDAPDFFLEDCYGVIADVAMSVKLWSAGRRFVRYRTLSIQHRYRGPRGFSTEMTKEDRRLAEDDAVRTLCAQWPHLIRFVAKPGASLGQQQCKFSSIGDPPLTMRRPTVCKAGRPYEGFADRPMTAAERQQKSRKDHHALTAS